jgi:hypothetical protein
VLDTLDQQVGGRGFAFYHPRAVPEFAAIGGDAQDPAAVGMALQKETVGLIDPAAVSGKPLRYDYSFRRLDGGSNDCESTF